MNSIDEEWEQYLFSQNKECFNNTNDREINLKDISTPPININIDYTPENI